VQVFLKVFGFCKLGGNICKREKCCALQLQSSIALNVNLCVHITFYNVKIVM